MDFLSGKKTYIGSALLSLISLVWALDGLLHDDKATPEITELKWLTYDQYVAMIAFVSGLTGASMRLAVSKVAPK